ncbi:MAG: hypothetical protein NTX50_04900 [Candidatus Sumerlaeota bacterium]|nr:hypothetical protein [Candidatus Sumerlaeota bacterium]
MRRQSGGLLPVIFAAGICGMMFAAPEMLAAAENDAREVLTAVHHQPWLDGRVTRAKDCNTTQSFAAPDSLGTWEKRKAWLHRMILVANGLWPLPAKTPLDAEVFDKKTHPDYTVEKVLVRTFPGFYLTGNLYRPIAADGAAKKYPAVLCPHGHWKEGRFENTDVGSIPGFAIGFARQGCVAFSYDMIGYNDSKRMGFEHRAAGEKTDRIWGIHVASLQLWNSIRAVDFLQSLPDVDPGRIACTGASGGGTQTFMLYAADDRLALASPINMISCSMQGGCICENPPLARLATNNMEIGSLFAPRPQLLVAATGDWTAKTPTVEYPAIRGVYRLYGKEDNIACHQENAKHNCNQASREAVYRWFGKFFYPGKAAADFAEKPFTVEAREDLSVFARREPPKDALEPKSFYERLKQDREAQLMEALKGSVEDFDKTYGEAYRLTMSVAEPDANSIQSADAATTTRADAILEKFSLRNPSTGQNVPVNLWISTKPAFRVRAAAPVLILHPEGKKGLVDAQGALIAEAKKYLDQGAPVMGIDCLRTGEYLTPEGGADKRAKSVDHFQTYNLVDVACQAQDVLLAERYLAERFRMAPEIIGLKGMGGLALLVHGLADHSSKTVADLSGLEFANDHCFADQLYIPNIRRAGDFVSSIISGRKRPVEWSGCSDKAMEARLQKAKAFAGK